MAKLTKEQIARRDAQMNDPKIRALVEKDPLIRALVESGTYDPELKMPDSVVTFMPKGAKPKARRG